MKEIRLLVSDNGPDGPHLVPFRVMVPEVKEIKREYVESMVTELSDCWGEVHVYMNTNPDSLEGKAYEMVDWDDAKILQFEFDQYLDYMAVWGMFGRQRMREIENLVISSDRDVVTYSKSMTPEEWISFADDDLLKSPAFMFYYAKDVCKGRLPDHLDNAMNMMSFNTPDNVFVKRYFATKRYRNRCGKSLRKVTNG